MRILCIGDVVGSIGCEFLRNNLPTLKKVKGVDFVICNGENSADGNGLTPVSAKHLLTAELTQLHSATILSAEKKSMTASTQIHSLSDPPIFPKIQHPAKV